jgi:hypothetical protein
VYLHRFGRHLHLTLRSNRRLARRIRTRLIRLSLLPFSLLSGRAYSRLLSTRFVGAQLL